MTKITIHDLMEIANVEGIPRTWRLEEDMPIPLPLDGSWYAEDGECFSVQYDDKQTPRCIFITYGHPAKIETCEEYYKHIGI